MTMPTRPTEGARSVPALSAETFIIPFAEDRFLVYAPLRKAAFLANAALVNKLDDIKEGRFQSVTAADAAMVEFLERLEVVNAEPEADPSTHFAGTPAPTMVTLFLTTACNLRCTYCYASAGDTPARFMNLEVAKQGIDFVANNAKLQNAGSFGIVYHGGGEPTVHWRVLTQSFSYAQQRANDLNLRASASCGTNGVLTEQQIDWVIANLQSVSLSFDGLPEMHDRHRITILGQPSSGAVIRTMRRFDESRFPYGLRVTVTADQTQRLPESVEFICANFSPKRIQIEPAYQLGRWQNAPSSETEAFIEAFREAQSRAMSHGKEILYSAARIDALTNHFCGITQDSFALTPDGNVSACYEVFSEDQFWASKFFYGRQSDEGTGFEFDSAILGNLRGQSVDNRAFCQGCFAKWHCAGDCYHKALSVGGDTEFAGSDRCHITRELTKDAILSKIANSGGMFWHEANDRSASNHNSAGKEMLL
jgi:uncharacterized protein